MDGAGISHSVDEPHLLDLDSMNGQSPPPISSPAQEADAVESARSPAKKRSHEEIEADSESFDDVTMKTVGGLDPAASQSQPLLSTTDVTVDQTTMPPPALITAAGSMRPPSQKPPCSGQGSQKIQASNNAVGRPPVAGTDSEMDDVESSSTISTVDATDANEPIDWQDLEQRYHGKIKEIDNTEHDILDGFDNLCNFFGVWAQAGSDRGVDRSFKRLKTQMTLVQHHEDELEKKRSHYIKVVYAFKSALELLADS